MHGEAPSEMARSIAALESAISKSQKALAQMARKGASTTLVERRLSALQIGLAALTCAPRQDSACPSSAQDLAEARNVLAGLLPMVKSAYSKAGEGSPQQTLAARRARALEVAIQAIDADLSLLHQGPRPPVTGEHREEAHTPSSWC